MDINTYSCLATTCQPAQPFLMTYSLCCFKFWGISDSLPVFLPLAGKREGFPSHASSGFSVLLISLLLENLIVVFIIHQLEPRMNSYPCSSSIESIVGKHLVNSNKNLEPGCCLGLKESLEGGRTRC